MSEYLSSDYIRMQNEMYLSGKHKEGLSAEIIVYADEQESYKLHVWYDEVDQEIIDRCDGVLFVKAYSTNGRDGVNTQTDDKIDFSHLGYGPHSTAALRRLIGLNAIGQTLYWLQDEEFDFDIIEDNHLNLMRANISLVKAEYGKTLIMSLAQAQLSINRA